MISRNLVYAEAPTRKGPRALEADLYLPERGGAPCDLVVWMHSGGFRSGSRSHPAHGHIARAFTDLGYGCAFIDYRLARPFAVLRPQTEAALGALIAEAAAAGEEMNETFLGERPLAVVEDCCAFLNRAAAEAADWGLSGRFLLGGSSAGAISALNTLYLPRHLGLARPEIATVFAFSGGFGYPPRLWPTGARILALHNAADDKVPVSSIRRFAAATPDPCVLIESAEQVHGSPKLTRGESFVEAIGRAAAFDRCPDPRGFAAALPAAQPAAQPAEATPAPPRP